MDLGTSSGGMFTSDIDVIVRLNEFRPFYPETYQTKSNKFSYPDSFDCRLVIYLIGASILMFKSYS